MELLKSNIGAFFILLCSMGFAQQKEFIQGILIDSSTTEPISYATIRVKNKAIGVISNMDGSFKIPSKFSILNDTLQISSMGYSSKEIIISHLLPDDINRVFLKPMLVELDGVTLWSSNRGRKQKKEKALSPTEIIARAIENIPGNYPLLPYSYVGYYRDYQWKDGVYTNLNEAIVEVFDKGFLTSDFEFTNTQIYEYWRNPNFPLDSISERLYDYENKTKIIPRAHLNSYGGNEFVILRIMDAIRNYNMHTYSYVYRLDTDFIKNHNFSLEHDTSLNGKGLYTIGIHKDTGLVTIKGLIYISKDNYEIHKLEYAAYDKAQRGYRSAKGGRKGQDNLIFRTLVEYKLQEGKMFPSYISFNNIFEVSEPPIFTVNNIFIDFENKRFEIDFNKKPLASEVQKKRNYIIIYKGKNIKIDRIVIVDGTKVFLYPKMGLGDPFLEVLYSNQDNQINEDDISVVMEDLVDIEGNKLDVSKIVPYNQFREFFVQQHKPLHEYPDNEFFMDANRPIFQDQPVKKPYNYEDFWMNTPPLNSHIKEKE